MKKIRNLLLAALLGLCGVIAVQSPAAATTYFNCQNGVACIWVDGNGGGTKLTVSVGQYGYNTCWALPPGNALYQKGSSASADFGGGWDLRVFSNNNCTNNGILSYQNVQSSHFENWGGDYFNDESESIIIMQT